MPTMCQAPSWGCFYKLARQPLFPFFFLRHEDWNLEKLVNNLPKLKWPKAGPLRCWNLFWKPLTVPPNNFWREKLSSSPVLCSCVLSTDTMSYETSRVCVWRGVPGVWGGRQPRLQGMKLRMLYQQFWSFFHSFYLLILRPFIPSLPLQMPPLLSPAATHFFSSPSPLHNLLWLVPSSPLPSPLPSMSPPMISPYSPSYSFITSFISYSFSTSSSTNSKSKEQSCLLLPWEHLSLVAAFSWLSAGLGPAREDWWSGSSISFVSSSQRPWNPPASSKAPISCPWKGWGQEGEGLSRAQGQAWEWDWAAVTFTNTTTPPSSLLNTFRYNTANNDKKKKKTQQKPKHYSQHPTVHRNLHKPDWASPQLRTKLWSKAFFAEHFVSLKEVPARI